VVKLMPEEIEKRKEQLRSELAFWPEAEREFLIEERVQLELQKSSGKSEQFKIKGLPKDYASKSEDYL